MNCPDARFLGGARAAFAAFTSSVVSSSLKRRSVTREPAPTRSHESPQGRVAFCAVTDEGIGIPEADLPRIFERFARGANVAGRITGSGVGLTIVRQIVEQHGGTVSVASTVGRGSTFTIRLPLATAPALTAAN